MGLQGPVDLKNPQVTFVYAEDYRLPHNSTVGGNSQLIQNWFGRLIGHGNRAAINRFDLKQREYIGNTSMDPELSLIMSNMALCTKGSLVLDPFCGTGSFLLTCSHFGAFSMGTDIDGRQIRGKSSLEHEMKKLVLAAEVSGGGDGGNDDSAREKTNPDEAFVDDNNTAIPVSNYHQSARENTTAVSTSASPAYNNLMVGSRVVVDVQVKEWTKSSKKPKSAREINSQKAFKLKLYKDIESNIKQYGLKNRVLDTVVCDSGKKMRCAAFLLQYSFFSHHDNFVFSQQTIRGAIGKFGMLL